MRKAIEIEKTPLLPVFSKLRMQFHTEDGVSVVVTMQILSFFPNNGVQFSYKNCSFVLV
jgi:hypothetical protein